MPRVVQVDVYNYRDTHIGHFERYETNLVEKRIVAHNLDLTGLCSYYVLYVGHLCLITCHVEQSDTALLGDISRCRWRYLHQQMLNTINSPTDFVASCSTMLFCELNSLAFVTD